MIAPAVFEVATIKLLTDRMGLAFHRESRVLPVYALVPGEKGPKLTKNDSNPNGLPSLMFRGLGVLPVLACGCLRHPQT